MKKVYFILSFFTLLIFLSSASLAMDYSADTIEFPNGFKPFENNQTIAINFKFSSDSNIETNAVDITFYFGDSSEPYKLENYKIKGNENYNIEHRYEEFGTYEIKMIIDRFKNFEESDETNNIFSSSITLEESKFEYDVIMEDKTVFMDDINSTDIIVPVTFKNTGNQDLSIDFEKTQNLAIDSKTFVTGEFDIDKVVLIIDENKTINFTIKNITNDKLGKFSRLILFNEVNGGKKEISFTLNVTMKYPKTNDFTVNMKSDFKFNVGSDLTNLGKNFTFEYEIENLGNQFQNITVLQLQLKNTNGVINYNTQKLVSLEKDESKKVSITLIDLSTKYSGTYKANLRFMSGQNTVTKSFNVSINNPKNGLTLIGTEFDFGNRERGSILEGNLTLKNTGSVDLYGISLSSTAYSFNSDKVFDLKKGDEKTVAYNFKIVENARSGSYEAIIKVDSHQLDVPLIFKAKYAINSLLEISKVKYSVGGSSRFKTYYDDIELKPNEELKLEFEVENLYSYDDDVDIEELEFDFEDSECFDGDTYKFDDVNSGDSEELEVSLGKMRSDNDENSCTIEYTLSGKDDNNIYHSFSGEIKIDVEREKHAISLSSITLGRDTFEDYQLPDKVSVNINKLCNIGQKDELLKISISSPSLRISKTESIELDEGDCYSNWLDVTLLSGRVGNHPIIVKISGDDIDGESKTFTVEIISNTVEYEEDINYKEGSNGQENSIDNEYDRFKDVFEEDNDTLEIEANNIIVGLLVVLIFALFMFIISVTARLVSK